jgi:hypothetical protein
MTDEDEHETEAWQAAYGRIRAEAHTAIRRIERLACVNEIVTERLALHKGPGTTQDDILRWQRQHEDLVQARLLTLGKLESIALTALTGAFDWDNRTRDLGETDWIHPWLYDGTVLDALWDPEFWDFDNND